MNGTRKDLVKYRLSRARQTLEDARILADRERWNSTINRLYYASYYAVSALLLNSGTNSTTHSGTKNQFSENFIKNKIIPKELGKTYSQLFTWRQKGDYDDLFDFTREKVLIYFDPVQRLIEIINTLISD